MYEITHLHFAKGHGNAVDANFDAGSKTLRMDVVVGPQFASAFGDYTYVSRPRASSLAC